MKIALIVDKPGWAYFNIAFQISRHIRLAPTDSLDIIAIDNPSSWQEVLDSLSSSYSLVHIFWRGATRAIRRKSNLRLTTSVYDHMDIEYGWIWDPNNVSLDGFWFSSNKIRMDYVQQGLGHNCPVLTDGVDTRLFTPTAFHKALIPNSLRIGWVGNSLWGPGDHKGFKTILLPALKKLRERGNRFSLSVCDQNTNLKHYQMVEYYQQIDLLLCTSKSEGTPNPILEASACGVPSISTDVGVVSDFKSTNLFPKIVSRSPSEFVVAIEEFLSLNSVDRISISESLRSQSLSWGWNHKAIPIINFLTDS